jgi:hypothetical protein
MAVTRLVFSISYNTDGVTTTFNYPDYLFQLSDLAVYYTPTGGAGIQLVMNSDYSLSGVADTFGAYPTGVVLTTLGLGTLASPLAPGSLYMTRRTQETQQIQYIDGDKFPAMKHEHALDKLTLIVQELSGLIVGQSATTPSTPGLLGQIILNALPDPGDNIGWVYTTQGWRAYGNISLL